MGSFIDRTMITNLSARLVAALALLAVTLVPAAARADEPDEDDSSRYYKRGRGVGIFHHSRLYGGVLLGEAPDVMDGATPVPGAVKDVTVPGLGFDGTYLALPSSFGHFHGIEMSTGVRGAPFDFWLSMGTGVTFFNLGRGGPGSLRVGGGFGAGFDLAHGYGYLRGRAALVIVPDKVDAEASATWTPPSASTGDFEQRSYRASVWLRAGTSKRAYEAFVEVFQRQLEGADDRRELDGAGGGIGISLF